MYIPPLYREQDRGKILSFLRRNNFPALVSRDGERLVATHTPVEVAEGSDGTVTIYAHIARANPQWKTLGDQEVLLIFQGAHAYISPRWYNHVNVPTWNYMMVHVYGKARLVEGEEFFALLSRLVHNHEAQDQYSLENLPQEFIHNQMKASVGLAIEVTRIEAGYKLSQNRNDEDHENIIRELEKRNEKDSTAVAREMRTRRKPAE